MVLDSQVDHTFQNAYQVFSDEKNKETWAIKDLLGLLWFLFPGTSK